MNERIDLRVITKNHAADPEIGFLTISISKPNGRALVMPTAWVLRKFFVRCGFYWFGLQIYF